VALRGDSCGLGREAALLKLDVPVAAGIGRVRAIAAIALYDSMPDGPTRRVDAADKLGLTGARRALLVETGILFVDAGGPDARVTAARGLLDRLPGAREGLEAIVIGDSRAPLRARGTVATAEDAPLDLDPAQALAELEESGIVLRDAARGLVDFPALHPSGRVVQLCWQMGEDDLGWWHLPEDGFAGRRRLPVPEELPPER